MNKNFKTFATILSLLIGTFTLTSCSYMPVLLQEEKEIATANFQEKVNDKFEEFLQEEEINLKDRSLSYAINCASEEDPTQLDECVLQLDFNEPQDFTPIEAFYAITPQTFDFLEKWSYGGQAGFKPKACENLDYCGKIEEVNLTYRGTNISFPLNEWEEATSQL